MIVLFYGQVHKNAENYKETGTDSINESSKNITKQAKKVHNFNIHVFQDSRVEVVVLPVFDGISLIRKKSTE
jgi:caffeoyl-CoA O-methyltransferase